MYFTLSFSVTEIRPLQPQKTLSFKSTTFSGIRTVFKLVHLAKALLSILNKLSGSTTPVKRLSFSKAELPIDKTVLGNDTDCKFLYPLKALSPTLVTVSDLFL